MVKQLYDLGEVPPTGVVPKSMWASVIRPERYGQPVPDLIPAHWLPNRWGQDWSNLVEVQGFDLDAALERNDTKRGAELDTIASLFTADVLVPGALDADVSGEDSDDGAASASGGGSVLDSLLDKSHKHAVGVSKDLRNGIRESIEILANEVIAQQQAESERRHDVRFVNTLDPKDLTRQCLRYLYRLLVLLYAEARPELGILPTDDEAYLEGYSLDRLRELCLVELDTDHARNGSHIDESLQRLFTLVNDGYHATHAEQVRQFDTGLQIIAMFFKRAMDAGVMVEDDPVLSARLMIAAHQVMLSDYIDRGNGDVDALIARVRAYMLRAFAR